MSDDAVLLFTQYSTQWDSLAHWGQMFDLEGDGSLRKAYYNGFQGDHDIRGPEAPGAEPHAHALGIERLAVSGAQGRGVLVDLTSTGHKAASFGYDDFMRRLEAQQVDVQIGDFLLVWAGYDDVLLGMNKKPDAAILEATGASLDGRDERLLQWIADSGVVAICSDNQGVETLYKDANPGGSSNPIHELCIFKLGIHLGELWRLGDLARWLSANQRSAFFLTAPPLRLPGAVGSPLTPIATV
jgi:kynurenine formamidase